jgi:hypothetical protein
MTKYKAIIKDGTRRFERKVFMDEWGNLYFKKDNMKNIVKYRGEDEIRRCGYNSVKLVEEI